MFWGQALIEFRMINNARSWPNFRAWHLKTDSKSAFATSLVGSRSPPLTTSFGISAFDMSRGTHPLTLPMSSRMRHFPNRRPPDHRIPVKRRSALYRRILRFRKVCIMKLSHFRGSLQVDKKREVGEEMNSVSVLQSEKKLVDVTGIEPVTPCLQSRCSPS